ncbi:MAG: mechanosensitive ion channel domain-containing protein [Flavobacteriaceae bacterium]
MKEFILNYQNELLGSVITILVLLIIRFVASKTIRRIGRSGDLNPSRTRLIIKYVSIGITTIGLVALIFIWGVNIWELGLLFSSIFAVIGVALFAQWSILSNITAGIILFLSFPFKIGDRIRILDKELETEEEFTIEDIRLYYIYLKNSNGDLITYPNSLMMQKAVSRIASSKT